MPQPTTELVDTPHGVRLEQLVAGAGAPTTVFAHGLAGSIATTRPLGSAVAGRRVFFQFRGHGRSDAPPGPWTYADLARDLRAVADLAGATRALGVSLGAGALCRLLAESPGRFERVVFFLPATLDRPAADPRARDRVTALVEAVAGGDPAEIAEAVEYETPPGLRGTPAVWAYLRQRVDQLGRDGLAPQVRDLVGAAAVPGRAGTAGPAGNPGQTGQTGTAGLAGSPGQTGPPPTAGLGKSALRNVTARALVLAAAGDETHPAEVAEELAALLPHAELHVYERPSPLWTARSDVRERIATFLNG